MQVEFRRVDRAFYSVFRIAYRARTHAQTVIVTLKDGPFVGRGEALGVSYHGESVDSILEQLQGAQGEIARGLSRADLQSLLPPGGARNAVDCALWDLEAKRTGRRAWALAEIPALESIVTDYTLSLDTPEAMAQAALEASKYSTLKLKLAGDGDLDRVAAVRAARPDVEIIVDANQAWSDSQLREFTPKLVPLGVKLIEQPLAADQDGALAEFVSPIPLCADESCQTRLSLPSVIGKYEYINIKLDKAGGLTEALALARAAQAQGLKLMVGCMGGSSLSMAPAFIVGQLCSVIDLDGPLRCLTDVSNPIRYEAGRMFSPARNLWG